MKGRIFWVLLTITALLVLAIPSASADGGPQAGFWLSGTGSWAIPCNSAGYMGGIVIVQVDMDLPAGYVVAETGRATGYPDFSFQITAPETLSYSSVGFVTVPNGGETRDTIQVFAPNGTLLTTAEVFASCVTGEIRITSLDVYGIAEPAGNQRVMATVLVDTPVYWAPGQATSTMLKAGETWIVVGQVTDDSGAVWYKVFVGAPTLVLVPASTMSLSGPLPDGSYTGTSPNPEPFPIMDLAAFEGMVY